MLMDAALTTLTDDPIPTRYSLLSRLKNWQDDESWREFFDTYWHLIYAVALKSGLTDAEAQEVVQETIICVAKNIQKFKRDRKLGSFKGWLRNLTHWRIADQLHRRAKMLQSDAAFASQSLCSLEEIPEQPSEAVASEWESEWQRNLLKAALDQVKRHVREEQYQLFDLYVIRQWPVDRISQTLGVSATRVYLAKYRITRLLKKEVRRLEKRWNSG
jgi:RNA polymerase sigma factor (sigma-70 family)